jgi:hypothetical protein
MPDITFCTYVTIDAPDAPLPPIGSVPVPRKPGSRGTSREPALVPSYFRGYLIGWYGSTTLQQISDARRSALAGGRTLFRIDIVVDGVDYAPSRQHVQQLDRLGVMHLDELPKETEKFVLERLEVGGPRLSGRYIISDLIWRHPAKLGNLWKIPELARRLTAVIFSAGVGGDARVYYAAVHPKRVKEIRLPANFPSGTKPSIQV